MGITIANWRRRRLHSSRPKRGAQTLLFWRELHQQSTYHLRKLHSASRQSFQICILVCKFSRLHQRQGADLFLPALRASAILIDFTRQPAVMATFCGNRRSVLEFGSSMWTLWLGYMSSLFPSLFLERVISGLRIEDEPTRRNLKHNPSASGVRHVAHQQVLVHVLWSCMSFFLFLFLPVSAPGCPVSAPCNILMLYI